MYGLIHNPGFSMKEGQEVDPSFWGDETWSGHTDHVHAATYKDPSEGPGVPSGNDSGGQADTGGDPRAIGCDMAAERGWTGDEWTACRGLWTQESNWDPNAVNPDSGAYGIPQSLGHGHPSDLGDAPAQIDWGLNYIADRYGDPATAEQHEEDDGWYSRGGVLANWADVMDSGGVFRPGLNVAVTSTGGDEQLVPKGRGRGCLQLRGHGRGRACRPRRIRRANRSREGRSPRHPRCRERCTNGRVSR